MARALLACTPPLMTLAKGTGMTTLSRPARLAKWRYSGTLDAAAPALAAAMDTARIALAPSDDLFGVPSISHIAASRRACERTFSGAGGIVARARARDKDAAARASRRTCCVTSKPLSLVDSTPLTDATARKTARGGRGGCGAWRRRRRGEGEQPPPRRAHTARRARTALAAVALGVAVAQLRRLVDARARARRHRRAEQAHVRVHVGLRRARVRFRWRRSSRARETDARCRTHLDGRVAAAVDDLARDQLADRRRSARRPATRRGKRARGRETDMRAALRARRGGKKRQPE